MEGAALTDPMGFYKIGLRYSICSDSNPLRCVVRRVCKLRERERERGGQIVFHIFPSIYTKKKITQWSWDYTLSLSLTETLMEGGGAYNPRTVEEVFRDFKGRRAAMIKALTTGNYHYLPISPSHSITITPLLTSYFFLSFFLLLFLM